MTGEVIGVALNGANGFLADLTLDLASGAAGFGLNGDPSQEQSSVPLYLRVARLIESRISEGSVPVGSLLPTENELASKLGISRQTVRQAIACLRDKGMISARKGVGTRVEASKRDWKRSYSVGSVADLIELARETEFRVLRREDIEARGKLAVELGCRAGRRWHRFEGPRYQVSSDPAFCWTIVYLDGRLAGLVRNTDVFRSAVFVLVEDRSGEHITEIKQDIRAATLDAEVAGFCGAQPGDLALEITRRYFGSGSRLLLLSKTILPGDRFSYSMTFNPD
jgi:DNA-binding GntR family transcriptional regulator